MPASTLQAVLRSDLVWPQYLSVLTAASALRGFGDIPSHLLAGRTAPHGYNVETEIIGTKATLRIGSVPAENMVELLDGQGVRRLCSYTFVERFGTAFLAELTEFASCIRAGRQPEITVQDGLEATRVAIAATRSFQQNELVRL